MSPGLKIAVVGCGIGGTACALMLAGRGHAVTLFERTAQVGPVGAGVLLQPSGQRVLAAMGLLDALIPTVERIDEVHAVTHRGRELVRLRYGDLRAGRAAGPSPFGVGLHRGDLFALLHGRLASAGVDLLLGTPVAAVRSPDRRPTLVDAAGRRHGPFDLVVAADGSRSALRAAAGVGGRVHEYAFGALWVVTEPNAAESAGDHHVPLIRGKLFQAARGTAELAGMLPVGGGRASLFWGLHRDAVAGLLRRGYGPWRDAVLRLMPQAEPLLDRVRSLDAARFVTYRHVHLPRAWRGRVAFVGDAAHAMSPHLGQGVNLALRDAEALATAIDAAPTIESAFAAYAEVRRWPVRYYAGVTAALTPFFQGRTALLGWGRDVALPLLCRFAPTRELMLRTLCGR